MVLRYAPFHEGSDRVVALVEAQGRFLTFRAVAGVAARSQERLDVADELHRGRGRRYREKRKSEGSEHPEETQDGFHDGKPAQGPGAGPWISRGTFGSPALPRLHRTRAVPRGMGESEELKALTTDRSFGSDSGPIILPARSGFAPAMRPPAGLDPPPQEPELALPGLAAQIAGNRTPESPEEPRKEVPAPPDHPIPGAGARPSERSAPRSLLDWRETLLRHHFPPNSMVPADGLDTPFTAELDGSASGLGFVAGTISI